MKHCTADRKFQIPPEYSHGLRITQSKFIWIFKIEQS